MDTPWPSFILTVLYIYFVKYGGPQYMENRKPYELRSILLVYNFSMVALSAYCFFEVGNWVKEFILFIISLQYRKDNCTLSFSQR